MSLVSADGRRSGSLDIAFFCFDGRGTLVGEQWQTLDVRLDDETYQRALTEGLRLSASVPSSGSPRHVKVVVYDYHSDRTGSAALRLR